MGSVDYMIAKPPPPMGLRSVVNRRVLPAAIEVTTQLENAIYALGQETRRQPVQAVLWALLLGALTARLFGTRP